MFNHFLVIPNHSYLKYALSFEDVLHQRYYENFTKFMIKHLSLSLFFNKVLIEDFS